MYMMHDTSKKGPINNIQFTTSSKDRAQVLLFECQVDVVFLTCYNLCVVNSITINFQWHQRVDERIVSWRPTKKKH